MTRLSAILTTTAVVLVGTVMAADPDVTCYNNAGSLKNFGSNIYQTQSACSLQCAALGDSVWATIGGNLCYCGNAFPSDGVVDYDQNCNINCLAWPSTKCGGQKAWTFGLTNTGTVTTDDGSGSSSTSKNGATPSPSVIATTIFAGSTVTATASGKPTSTSSTGASKDTTAAKSGSTAGIAAGVVVGVIVVIALCVGAYLFLRRRRRIQAEEEYRAAVSAKEFTQVNKPLSDHRLDPVMLQQRRLSDGSIADNQDYSRRILKVINPDGN